LLEFEETEIASLKYWNRELILQFNLDLSTSLSESIRKLSIISNKELKSGAQRWLSIILFNRESKQDGMKGAVNFL